jgi:thioester reductase-like protein
MPENIYLTGSTGYLGQQLVKDLVKKRSVETVYTPIRDKHGQSARARYDRLFGDYSKTKMVSFYEPVPSDTTVVVLSGYSVNFGRSVFEFMLDNRSTLDQLSEIGDFSRLKQIVFVSTAYVKAPGPSSDQPVFNEPVEALMDRIIEHQLGLKDLRESAPEGHIFTNSYIYSKALMEQVLTLFCDRIGVPLRIARPSQITVSRDGHTGTLSNLAGGAFLAATRLVNFHISSPNDAVYVDEVSERISGLAVDFSSREALVYLTNGTDKVSNDRFRTRLYPHVWTLSVDSRLYPVGKRLNRWVVGLLFPQQLRYYDLFYQNYEYFTTNRWEFPRTFTVNADYMVDTIGKYVKRRIGNGEKGSKRPYIVLSLLLFVLIWYRKRVRSGLGQLFHDHINP